MERGQGVLWRIKGPREQPSPRVPLDSDEPFGEDFMRRFHRLMNVSVGSGAM